MNNYFSDAVSKLDIDRNLYVITATNFDHSVDRASILKTNQLGYPRDITESSVAKSIENLDYSNVYQKNNIPPKMLKASDDMSALLLCSDNNRCISEGRFPNNLKSADLTPTYKMAEQSSKGNLWIFRLD